MANWILLGANQWQNKIYDRLHEELLKQRFAHADETTLQVLQEPRRPANSKPYMWLYRSGRYEQPVVLYEYQENRRKEHPKNFLAGFKAKELTDAERTTRNELLALGKDPELPMPYLDEPDDKIWTVPAVNVEELVLFRGYIRDEAELVKDLAYSDAFQVAANLLNSALVETKLRRPLLPFRRTHLATLIASGALNGAIGIGEDRHMVNGVSRKKITRETVVDENGGETVVDTESYITIVREFENQRMDAKVKLLRALADELSYKVVPKNSDRVEPESVLYGVEENGQVRLFG